MSKILGIGYGNTLRRDDGLGQVAVQRIESLVQGHEVKVMIRHQMGIELAEALRDADLAIFIDAHVGDEPGTLKETEVVPENAPRDSRIFLAADSFDYRECLSPSVEVTIPVLIDRVLTRIAAFRVKGETIN